MDPIDNPTVVDNGTTPVVEEVTTESTPKDGGVTPDIDSWKEDNKVPYSRFEDVVRINQEYRNGFSKQIDELKALINNSSQPQPQPGDQTLSEWDKRASEAKSWGEFVQQLQEDTFSKWESRQKDQEAQASKKLEGEIKSLYDAGIVTNKSEENAVIQFALKKQEELKAPISLSVAAAWMKESKPTVDNKDGASKTLSPKKSNDGPGKTGFSYSELKSKGLDEIVMEAKDNAPRA